MAVVQFVALSTAEYNAVLDLWQRAGLHVKPEGRDSREQFAVQQAHGTQTVIGALEDGKLCGVVIATHDGRKGWINRLAVDPEYRRRGIGQALIAEAERTLRAQGMQIVAALIEDWNQASLALFMKAGYVDFPDVHYVTKREGPDV